MRCDPTQAGGVTIGSQLRGGWWWRTERQSEGEFFRATITRADFLGQKAERRRSLGFSEAFSSSREGWQHADDGGMTGQTQDPGRRDVLPQMAITEVLPWPILSATPPCYLSATRPSCSCRACWPPNAADAAPAPDAARWAATGRRC